MKFYTYAVPHGNSILYRYVKDGVDHLEKIAFKPTLYIPSNKESKYKTLSGQQVSTIMPGSIKDCRTYIDNYSDVAGFGLYGNTHWEQQFIRQEYNGKPSFDKTQIRGHFLDIEVVSSDGSFPHADKAEHPVVANTQYDTIDNTFYVFCTHKTQKYIHNKNHPVLGNLNVKVFNFSNELQLLNAWIGFMRSRKPHWISGWNSEGFDIPYLVNRIRKLFGEDKLKELSPFNVALDERTIRDNYGNKNTIYQIKGIPHLDYLQLYKKHTYTTQESYKLDHIGEVELGENKLEYDGSINDFYHNDFQGYIEYNIQDVNLVKRIDDKLKLMDVTYALTYIMNVNFTDTLATVKPWEGLLYNLLMDKNIVFPLKSTGKKDRPYAGAYVMVPELNGIKRWVVSCDLNSMYPHLIQQYNLGPDTIIEDDDLPEEIKQWRTTFTDLRDDMSELLQRVKKPESEDVEPLNTRQVDRLINKEIDTSILKKHKICMSANGQFFRTDKMSILSEIMRKLYDERKSTKKKMLAKEQELVIAQRENNTRQIELLTSEISSLDNMQMALKICLNSGYGAIGNEKFRFFDIRVAEAITLGGQYAIRWIGHKSDDYFNKLMGTNKKYTVYTDTDSVYLEMNDVVKKIAPNVPDELKIVSVLDSVFENKVLPFMSAAYEESAQYMNAYENRMFMAREVISPRAAWTAKKRYIMEVWNSEGVQYDKPKLKVMGLEAVRSTTPKLIRDKLKESYKIILNDTNDEIIEFIDSFRNEYYSLPIETISLGSSVNGLLKYKDNSSVYRKGTPKHVKGALQYNRIIVEHGLDNKYESIKEGEKIRYVTLKLPNIIMDDVISFVDKLPPELKLHSKVDRQGMFDKAYVKPLQPFFDQLNWTHEKVNNLSAFF